MYRRMKKQPWLLALMAALGVVLVSLTGLSVTRSRVNGELPLRSDLVADFKGGPIEPSYADANGDNLADDLGVIVEDRKVDTDGDGEADAKAFDDDGDGFWEAIDLNEDGTIDEWADQVFPEDGSGLVTALVTRGGKSQSAATALTSARVALAAADVDCRPSAATACRYHLVGFTATLQSFKVFGTRVRDVEVDLVQPVYDLFDEGDGLVLPSTAKFRVRAWAGPWQRDLIVSPQSLQSSGEFAITPDLDTEQLTILGSLVGETVDDKGKRLELELEFMSASTVPFVNVPPVADAGPDQTVTTSCVADVTLSAKSTDANGNLTWAMFSEGRQSFGTAPEALPLLPGTHLITHTARDIFGSEDVDQLTVTVEDDGTIEVPAGASLVELKTPAEAPFEETALLASEKLKISDRVVVKGANQDLTKVVNIGTADGQIRSWFHADSSTRANVWSAPKAWLLERSLIEGRLYTSVAPDEQNNTDVKGGVAQPYEVTDFLEFSFVLPPRIDAEYVGHIEPDTVKEMVPGDYAQVYVKSRARLKLEPGIYRFSDFWMEPGSVLEVSDEDATAIFVDGTATFRGSVPGASAQNLTVVALGANEVIVTSPFRGSVLAPNGKLTLNSSGQTKHVGSFFAKEIQVDSDAVIEHEATAFPDFAPPRAICALTPKVKCVEETEAGLVAHFTYENAALYEGISIRRGINNRIVPGASDQGQPQIFQAGRHDAPVYRVPFNENDELTWVLGAKPATANQNTKRCE